MNNLISIIMPAYNAQSHIEDSIVSILNQTYENWELIIVDDCSTDSTSEIIKKYADLDNRVVAIHLKQNSGVANARNIAMNKAKGSYLAFCDSDDLWTNNKLSIQLEKLIFDDGFFSCGSYYLIDENDNVLDKIFRVPAKVNYKTQLNGSSIGCLTVMINLNKVKKFKLQDVGHEDYLAWQIILKNRGNVSLISEPIGYYRIGNTSLSSNKFKSAKWQYKLFREYLNLSIIESLYHEARYILNGLFKYDKLSKEKEK